MILNLLTLKVKSYFWCLLKNAKFRNKIDNHPKNEYINCQPDNQFHIELPNRYCQDSVILEYVIGYG